MDKIVRSICNNLASNDLTLRRKGFKNVRDLFKKNANLDDLSLHKLCKGLYYCLWMTDDFVLVHKLSLDIIQLYKYIRSQNNKSLNNYSNNKFKIDMNEVDSRLRYLRCLFESVSREWLLLDKNRVDKMLLFTRILVSELLYYMNDLEWDLMALNKLSEVYLNPNVFNQNCLGLWLHFIQIYVNELLLNYEHLRNTSSVSENNEDTQLELDSNSDLLNKESNDLDTYRLDSQKSHYSWDTQDTENSHESYDSNTDCDHDNNNDNDSPKTNGIEHFNNRMKNKQSKTRSGDVFNELDGVKLLYIIKPFIVMFVNTKDQMVLKSIFIYVFKNLEKLSKITNINAVVHLLQSLLNNSNRLSFKSNNSDLDRIDSQNSHSSCDSSDFDTNVDCNDEYQLQNNDRSPNSNNNKVYNNFSGQPLNVVSGTNRKYLKSTLKMYQEHLKIKLNMNESIHVQQLLYSLYTMASLKRNDIISNTDIAVELDKMDSECSYYDYNNKYNKNKENNRNNNNNNALDNDKLQEYNYFDSDTDSDHEYQLQNNDGSPNYNRKHYLDKYTNTDAYANYEHIWADNSPNRNRLFEEHLLGKDEIILKKQNEERKQLMEQDYINLSNVSLKRINIQRMRNLCILNNTKNYLILVKANDINSINFMKKLKEPRIQNQLFYYSLIRLRRLKLMYKFKHNQLNKIYDFNKNIKTNFTINLKQALDNIKNIKPMKSSLMKHENKSLTEGERSRKKKRKVVFNLKKNQVTNIPCRKKKSCNPLSLFNLM